MDQPTSHRLYKCSDAAMLIGGATITSNALRHQEELAEIDTSYTVDYFDGLSGRIDTEGRDILGADYGAAHRQTTINLMGDHHAAHRDLGLVKTVIENKFAHDKPRKAELLTNLGFAAHFAKTGDKQQESMGAFLAQFNKNLTQGLEDELTGLGLAASIITRLRGHAATYSGKNVTQEGQKAEHKELTAADAAKLNGIYKEVIAICKTGQRCFAGQQAVRDGFVFDKVIPGGSHSTGGNTGT